MAEEKNTDSIPEMDNMILLQDERGRDIPFEFLDLLEYEGKEYVVLLPAEDDGTGENDEVVILEVLPVQENPDLEQYVSVESEEILNAVFEIFKEKFKDAFNFIDE
ncbi:MAG TPA: DUF1292 domain-containing protein [Candidatus Eubacterium avistercoris]|uniref:DUF1292 domain-containing protein n=1 Tax=Candidatus Eubacterium avistercoris TaxID=2838567 RepID=A0A9D2D2I7_9FIRM|nr:DUF1292 domain-containing protein [Candidatus Eubacterium avistercoris]